jgi:integrase
MRKLWFYLRGAIMCRDYYLHTRKNGIYYVQFVNKVSGKLLTARSTGETELRKAELKAEMWKTSGIPSGKSKKPRALEEAAGIEGILRAIRKTDLNSDDALLIVSALKSTGLIDISATKNTGRSAIPFIQFLETFWDYDKSEYIQDKLALGYGFTRGHALKNQRRILKDIKPFFGETKLNAVTKDDLKRLTRQLTDRGLATSTKRQTILICCTPLKWAFEQGIIPVNPALGLKKFSITNEERGVLTEVEAATVFTTNWKDKRAFVGSLVGCTTGARLGEILALRLSDIKEKTLSIIHSYSPFDGLKCPKNGKKRNAPLLPEVKAALLDLLKDNPHDTPDPFIFYSIFPDKPTDPQIIRDGLNQALEKTNVDKKSRNIVFHSWRHFFCSKMTEKIDSERVAKVSGHISDSVFKKYADHIEAKNITEVNNVAAQVFRNIIPFPLKKAG